MRSCQLDPEQQGFVFAVDGDIADQRFVILGIFDIDTAHQVHRQLGVVGSIDRDTIDRQIVLALEHLIVEEIVERSRMAGERNGGHGPSYHICGRDGIGRRAGFRYLWPKGRVGSSPTARTKKAIDSISRSGIGVMRRRDMARPVTRVDISGALLDLSEQYMREGHRSISYVLGNMVSEFDAEMGDRLAALVNDRINRVK